MMLAAAGGLMPQSPPSEAKAGHYRASSVGPFEFHSGFWINLHHFLYQQALQDSETPPGSNVSLNDIKLSAAEQSQWGQAVAFYRQSIIQHDLLSDPGMNTIDTILGDAEGSASLDSSGLKDDLVKVLQEAAPVYRAHWWSGHDRANRFWIRTVTPMVQELGPALMKQLSTAYNVPWPAQPIRVDVACYANWAGAYTYRSDHVHTIISSVDPSYQGFAALEMLFHEASHRMVSQKSGHIADQITRECKSDGIPVPRNLVHVMIFFTAGEFARRDLAGVGVAHYQPYALKNGLYPRSGWTRIASALDLFWMPHLDGKAPLDVSIVEVIDALAVGQSAAVAPPEPGSKNR